jgi:hypothetical protein
MGYLSFVSPRLHNICWNQGERDLRKRIPKKGVTDGLGLESDGASRFMMFDTIFLLIK